MKKGNIAAVFVCLLAAGAAVYAFCRIKPALIPPEPVAETETTVTTTETTAAATEPPKPFGYEHGEEGFFSLIEAKQAPAAKTQDDGSDWVCAAASAMEAEHMRTTGKPLSVDPYMLMDSVYRRFKAEGYFLRNDEISALSVGGSSRDIINSMSTGYNGFLLTDANELNGVPKEELQEIIRKQGALQVRIPDREEAKGTFGDYSTFNAPDAVTDDCTHSVIMIGFDDHFPKDYFQTPANQDGAWLIQDNRPAENPYYWISYDTPLAEIYNYTVSGMHGTVSSYDCGAHQTLCSGTETAVANVFHHPGTLTAVGTYTTEPGQQMTVEVRAGEFGSLICAQNAVFPYMGYHTIKLETPQPVGDCTVIVRFTGSAPVEGSKWQNETVEYRVSSEPGQSYLELEGEWFDLAEPDNQQILGLGFAPNNACIKAVFQ